MPEVQEEKWEALGEGVGLFTDAAHRFGEDALLLADFARPRPGERCCDLGTGGGIIPFQWLAQGANNVIDGIDLDPEAIVLARRVRSPNREGEAAGFSSGGLENS